MRKPYKRLSVFLPVVLTLVLPACTIMSPPMPNDPSFAPVYTNTPASKVSSKGSLYQVNNSISLFEDQRARRIGDILTIVLSERTAASKSADTDIKKDNEITIDDATLFGRNISFKEYSLAVALSQERQFESEAGSDQSNSLSGSIAVTVSEILPNGLIVVRGEKWMTLNTGDEYIHVKGLVRPDDVGPNNTILSTKLADARISYSGTGAFADSNEMGWGAKFFNSSFWPF